MNTYIYIKLEYEGYEPKVFSKIIETSVMSHIDSIDGYSVKSHSLNTFGRKGYYIWLESPLIESHDDYEIEERMLIGYEYEKITQ